MMTFAHPFRGRTINNIELLKIIEQNPKGTIGQRNFDLLQAFCIGHWVELQNVKDITERLRNVPSMHDFVSKKYNCDVPGALSWTYPLTFFCEDQRELYFEFFKNLWEYEEKYPLPEEIKLNFIPRFPRPDFVNLLATIKYRPQMYFPRITLSSLRAFLDGYFHFLGHYGFELSGFEKMVLNLINKCKKMVNPDNGFETWDRRLEWKDENGWIYEGDDEKSDEAFFAFFRIIEQRTGTKLEMKKN